MTNDILDEVDDVGNHSGPRTCPECGHQFPFWKFVSRYLRSYGLSKWPCHGCRELIKCDFIKIQIFWLIGLLIHGILFGLLISYFELDGFKIILLIPYLVFVLFTLFYAKFEKSKE